MDCRAVHAYVPWLTGLGSSLASNPYPTLKSITLDLGVIERQENNFLHEMNRELKLLSKKNTLQVLEVKAWVVLEVACSSFTNTWAADLDELLTDVGAYPELRQVSVNLKHFHDYTPIVPGARNPIKYSLVLTARAFPRLLESATIGFVFRYVT